MIVVAASSYRVTTGFCEAQPLQTQEAILTATSQHNDYNGNQCRSSTKRFSSRCVYGYFEHFAHTRKTNSFNGVHIEELGEVSGN
jgi:hypothetical protein